MTLREQIAEMDEKTNKLIAENPGMKNIWWEIADADLNEMKDLETDCAKMDYCEASQRMRFNAFELLYSRSVIFVYSKPVKVKRSLEIIEIESETTQPA